MDYKSLALSFHRALIGQLSNHIRAITIDWNDSRLKTVFYFDREPTEFDVDLANMITGEVISDFPEISNEDTVVVFSNLPVSQLEKLKAWIIKRKEDEIW